jgi:hypothetical protein
VAAGSLAGGKAPGANVARSAPLEQKAEYERLVGLVERTNNRACLVLAFV